MTHVYPRRYWLHALLFLLTLATTTIVGAVMAHSFRENLPFNEDLSRFAAVFSRPSLVAEGLPFSLVLLAILLAHEMGHYLACVYYRVDASLPYFLPGPTFIGTFGAFIRIRSPIYSKRVLFDIGVAGPIAGFVFLLPALSIGLAFSKVSPGIAHHSDLSFGTPPILWILERLIFPGVPSSDIYLHPVARAGWVGVFATALNLLPIGQLDGGHILYAVAGRWYRLLSRGFLVALVPLGFLYWRWWAWAALLLLFGLKHPVIYDVAGLSPGRRRLSWLALLVLALCFMPIPIHTGVWGS